MERREIELKKILQQEAQQASSGKVQNSDGRKERRKSKQKDTLDLRRFGLSKFSPEGFGASPQSGGVLSHTGM